MTAFAIREAQTGDNPALQRLLAVPQPSGGVKFAFERLPDYFRSAHVMYRRPETLVVTHKDEQAIAMVNIGWRDVYVNGIKQAVRYGADLRIDPAHQGGRALLYLNRALKNSIQEGWYQSVILRDNQRSKQSLEGGRAGLPLYRSLGDIETHTITACHSQPQALLPVRQATVADIPAMNALVKRMADFYQFLPVYDFNGLLQADPYFAGLTIEDFVVIDGEQGLRGLMGLWNQKEFKQTRVIDYPAYIAWLRPFYNAFNYMMGGFILPMRGETLNYLVVHSPLTDPNDLEAFAALLQVVWQQARQQRYRALTLTLAANDPRRAILAGYRTIPMVATQYSVAFSEQAQPVLDDQRVAYFEAGRL